MGDVGVVVFLKLMLLIRLCFSPLVSGLHGSKVFKVEFWMRNYCSPSMKPTMVITNNSVFGCLDLGPVPPGRKKRAVPTTRRYLDQEGRVRFVGTASLKKSQTLVLLQIVNSPPSPNGKVLFLFHFNLVDLLLASFGG